MDWTAATVRTAAPDPWDLLGQQACQVIAERMGWTAPQVPRVPLAPLDHKGSRVRAARRVLPALRVRRATRARLLSRALRGTRVRS